MNRQHELVASGQSETEMMRLEAGAQWKELAKMCRRELRRNPESICALERLAKAQWNLSDYDGLVVSTRRLIKLNAFEPGYLYLQGIAYQVSGRYVAAMRALRLASMRAKDSDLVAQIEDARATLDQWQSQLVEQLLRYDPEFRGAYGRNAEEACRDRGFEFSWSDFGLAAVRSRDENAERSNPYPRLS